MKLKKEKDRKRNHGLLPVCLVLVIFLGVASLCAADDHKEHKGRSWSHELEEKGAFFGKTVGGKRDEGNETTGQLAAWSLGAINLTVALSLLIRGIKRFAPLTPELTSSITKFNHLQKKHLMRFHYYLNPLFVGVAVLHWALSRCPSTALTEWGLTAMCIMAALGIMLKFKLVPKDSLRSIYRVHTQPVIFLSLICVLVIGHLIMD